MAAVETRGELSLSLIQDLGGTKEDLQLLKGLGEDEDEAEDLDLDAANDWEVDPIKKDELRDFIEQLGIKKHRLGIAEGKREKGNDAALPRLEAVTNKKKDNEAEALYRSGSPTASSQKTERRVKNKFKVQHPHVTSTTLSEEESLAHHLQLSQHRSYLLHKPGDPWLDGQTLADRKPAENELIQKARNFAAVLMEKEVTLYKTERERRKRSDSQWMKTVLTSGTLSDKMAALTLLVQESPVHSLHALDTLLAMARKKGKREAMMAADTLKELMVSCLLPGDRKLIAFDARPVDRVWSICGGNKDVVDRKLLSWYVEAELKERYSAFIAALDMMSFDTILATKRKALDTMQQLLIGKPEQEHVLLPKVVNKLGDPDYKLASHASYLLIRLVEQHPNMQEVIVAEVERLVYRPGISQRAQYYAMCFLNQIKLHSGDNTLAAKLINIYFSFFKMYVKKGEVDSKMMGALLSGVNRAYPFAQVNRDSLSEQIGTLYKIVHLVNFNTALQALMLLQQVSDPSTSEGDRFLMALYRKMLDSGLKTSAKHPQFLNLIYRSMKADVCEKRVKAFIKRLLQVGSQLGPNFLCGALIVLSQILKERPELLAVKQVGQREGIDKGKSVKVTNSRLVDDDDDDEDEHFVDLPVPEEFQDQREVMGEERDKTDKAPSSSSHNSFDASATSSWVHRKNLGGRHDQHEYAPFQRNPLYCHAEHAVLFELHKLVSHYHPSVSLFARSLLQGQRIVYSGDPLQDFTLIRFLDRFVYKNPKKVDPASQQPAGACHRRRETTQEEVVPVNSAKFIEGGEARVPAHERYLYKYFSQRAQREKKDASDEESEAGSVSDSEFDAFLETYEKDADDGEVGDVDMDFASQFSKSPKQKSDARGSENELSDNEEDVDDLSDEEMELDEDDELAAEFRKEMEDLGDDSDDELKQMMLDKKKGKKRSSAVEKDAAFEQKAKRSRGLKAAGDGIFAAAEEFADVLEENASNTLGSMGTSYAVSNPDKASVKQLAWEAERDRFIHDRHWRQVKAGRKGGKHTRPSHHRHQAQKRKHGKMHKSGKKKK